MCYIIVMREEMRHIIEGARDIVKKEKSFSEDFSELDEIIKKFNELSREVSANRLSQMQEEQKLLSSKPKTIFRQEREAPGRVQEIIELQRKKDDAMDKLHDMLRCIDDPLCKKEQQHGERLVIQQSSGELLAADGGGGVVEISFGDLLADTEWGIRYFLDAESIPRDVQKQYAIYEAKRELRNILDQQLAFLNPSTNGVRYNLNLLSHAIESGQMFEAEGGKYQTTRGAVAEHMVYASFLRKSFDKLFVVTPADIDDDASRKSDLFIEKRNRSYLRGVDVETIEMDKRKRFGIQFSLDVRHSLRKKQKGIKKVVGRSKDIDDIVVVRIPGDWPEKAFKQWIEAGKPSGGPEQFLSEQTKHDLFFETLKGMFTESELEEQWAKMGHREHGK